MTGVKEELARKARQCKGEEKKSSAEEVEAKDDTGETAGGCFPVRLLRAEEIECRIATINEKGLSLLLFKDARADQRLLDEVFTPFGWKRTHQMIDGNLYCTVEIWDREKQQWIGKQDVGTASYSEKEKGQASDSFKRACFNWGIGRELYTAPFIWIPAEKTAIQRKGDKYTSYNRFSVSSISYNQQREITALSIVNERGELVYEKKVPSANTNLKKEEHQKTGVLTLLQKKTLEKELERTGVALETVLERYGIHTLEEMTGEIYKKALQGLKKTKTKEAA